MQRGPHPMQANYLTNTVTQLSLQVAQLSQLSWRNRAAGWVSFGWVVGNGVGQTILYTKRCWCLFYLLHNKSTFI